MDFFWNNNCENIGTNKHKLHTIGWDKICRPKCKGGLGIRCTEDMNVAFLAKQCWKVSNSSK